MEIDLRANGATGTAGQTAASPTAEPRSSSGLPARLIEELREVIHQLEQAQTGESGCGAPPEMSERLQAIAQQLAQATAPAAVERAYAGPGEPRVRPWEAPDEQHSELPELVTAASLRAELLQRTNGKPWTDSWELLAENEGR